MPVAFRLLSAAYDNASASLIKTSEPLAALLGAEKLSRPQVVKGLWAYIKERNLQNPADRREILCDDALRAIFNRDKISMFDMNKELIQYVPEVCTSAVPS